MGAILGIAMVVLPSALPFAAAHSATHSISYATSSVTVLAGRSGSLSWSDLGAADKTWTVQVAFSLDQNSADDLQDTIVQVGLWDGNTAVYGNSAPLREWIMVGGWPLILSFTAHSNAQPDLFVVIYSKDTAKQVYHVAVDASYW